VAEASDRAANLAADANWAREACAFVIFIHNVVRNFVASELMLLACIATLRYWRLYLYSKIVNGVFLDVKPRHCYLHNIIIVIFVICMKD